MDCKKRSLLREINLSWRLEEKVDFTDFTKFNNLLIKCMPIFYFLGVVFNEMKGAFADPQSVFGQALLNNLLPSDTYGICSGGLPECIPELTWENLKNFHSVHYSPHNARFYTYGNLPLEEHLKSVEPYLPPNRYL